MLYTCIDRQANTDRQTDKKEKKYGYCSDLLVARVEVHDKSIMFFNVKRLYQNQLGLYHKKKMKPLQPVEEYEVRTCYCYDSTHIYSFINYFFMLISKCIIKSFLVSISFSL